MTYLNINLKLEELTEAVLNCDMNTLMKLLAITVFNAYYGRRSPHYILRNFGLVLAVKVALSRPDIGTV